MCLLIYKPAGYTLQKRAMRYAFQNNPDGYGIASMIRGEFFRLDKGLTNNFDEFWEAYCQYSDLEQVVHLRYATHGEINEDLVHPFPILDGNTVLFHNGSLTNFSKIPEGESDTSWFVKTILRPEFEKNPECFLDKEWVKKLSYGVNGGRMIILRNDGKKAIINKGYGFNYGPVWFSNFNYLGGKVERPKPTEEVKDYKDIFSDDD